MSRYDLCIPCSWRSVSCVRLLLKCDGTRAETRFHLSAKQTSPFKLARASVQSTTGSWVVRISGSNAGYTMFWGSVRSTGYPLNSPVFLQFPFRASPCAITFKLDSTSDFANSVSTSRPYPNCNRQDSISLLGTVSVGSVVTKLYTWTYFLYYHKRSRLAY
jgi:hypothetical protein